MKFELVTGLTQSSDMAALVSKFLEYEGFSVHHLVDMGRLMKLVHGKANPYVAFVVIAPDETTMFSMYDVVRYIESTGLKPH